MKRHFFRFALLLSLLIIPLCTTSCGETETADYHIGVSQCSDDAWRTKLNEEMQRELLFYPGVSLEVRSADDDNERQARDIDYFIAQGVDLLIVSPNRADSLTPAVSKAFDAGIPVIVADRKVTGDKYTAFVGGDNFEVGKLQGEYLQRVLPQGGKVLEVMGLMGSTPQELRHQGLMESISDVSARYQFVQCMAAWKRDKGEAEVLKVLAQHPDVKVILSQNDQMAIGASRALQSANLDHKVFIMGVDGLTGPDNGIEAIRNGTIDVSATYTTGGDLIVQTAMKILQGEPFERDVVLPTALIDMSAAKSIDNVYREVDHQIETVKMLQHRADSLWQQLDLERTLMYVLLAFLAMALLFLIVFYSNYMQKRRLGESLNRQKSLLKAQRDQLAEQNIQLKRLSQQVEEATKAKIAFFTNVSHDFRTPLTLISAPLEQIQQKLDRGELDGAGGKDPEATQLLILALKNVKVLQRLVGQLLDFRKLESGKLELDLKPVDLCQACQTSFGYFKGLAYKKHIKLDFSAEEGDYRTMADLSKLERVFFNLMGNAFKFTPENGKITVSLSIQPSTPSTPSNPSNLSNPVIVLRVSDTGPGINVEHIQRIFENFYQVDSARHEGSGIGLAVAKSFVELHGGTIDVQNQPVGTGTIFTVTIPRVAVTEDEMVDAGSLQIDAATIETELGDSFEGENAFESEPKPLVLVIDDNADLRQYMQMLLGEQYRVITAGDGLTGVGKAMRTVPDVIVCDMMMPVMDGIECCRRLKQEVNTSHIPILMLTANALDEQRVKGLAEGGADAYMSKPFNADVLRAQLRSLVDNHNRVRNFFGPSDPSNLSNPSNSSNPSNPSTPSLDDRFLVKMKDIIERSLSDSDFGVEQLGDLMGMSRAQLYRKTKALTNYSPVELIRNMRLKRAQQMLAQGDDTIAQVAYSVGFTAPSYFTKCYKDFFGEMPNELVKRKGG
ncbi:MAG: substrate-binding domain-containing protein [Bacteroidales bacterium]|nr:substrate-binding domain-containing protein [Bacteroidales bacterium]